MFSLTKHLFLLFNKYKVTFFSREIKTRGKPCKGLKLALSQMTQVVKDALLFAASLYSKIFP